MTNSLNLTLSGKHFICPSILNDSFAGYSTLGCRSFPFMTSNTSFQALLACKVSFEKSADSIMGTLLQVTLSFPLAAFKILFPSFFPFFFFFIYLFLEIGEGRKRERQRIINVWLPLACPLLGTWPAIQACALMGNGTCDLLVRSLCSIC